MHDDFMMVVRTKASGSIDYAFPQAGESKPARKCTCVNGVGGT